MSYTEKGNVMVPGVWFLSSSMKEHLNIQNRVTVINAFVRESFS